jgi:hypothetical protein
MGKVIVNCINRPKDEMIDCGVYGSLLNMHEHNLPGSDDTVVLGFPLEKGKKLPVFGESKPTATSEKKEGDDS